MVLWWYASSTGSVVAFESSEFFFVSAGLGGDGFQGGSELVDLDLQAGEGERVSAALAVFFDDGAQFGAPVEGGAADPDAGGDRVEGDVVTVGEELSAGLFDADGELVDHGVDAWFMIRSSRFTRSWWRAASSCQPRASASAARAAASARWAARMGRNVCSVRKLGQCSQMLA